MMDPVGSNSFIKLQETPLATGSRLKRTTQVNLEINF